MKRFFTRLGTWLWRQRRRIGLLALSGLLGALSFPLSFSLKEILPSGVLEPLAFICLVPALVAVRGLRPKRAFGAGFFGGLCFFCGAFWWVTNAMTQFTPLGPLSALFMMLLAAWCALHWGLAFSLVRFFSERLGWAIGLTLAPVWMATELMRNYFMSGFPWANLGYSQARNLWFSQIASLVGVYGIAFVIAFVNGALYELLRALVWKERKIPVGLLAGSAAVLVAGHVYGALRIRSWDEKLKHAERMKVAVIQGNIDQRLKIVQGSYQSLILSSYNPATSAADAAGADLIVWPEGSYPGAFPKGHYSSVERTGLAQSHYRGELLLGVDVYDPRDPDHDRENAAFVVTPDLRVAFKYAKNHLVPFGEYVPFYLDRLLMVRNLVPGTFKPGDSLEPAEVPRVMEQAGDAKVGIEICFDAIFPEISRTYAREGAQILVNMTNDAWYGFSSAAFQFLRMVELRAIESGRPIARAANTGISGFIDPLGRITDATPIGLADTHENSADMRLKVAPEWRVADLPLVNELTVYDVIGDWPAYLASLFCLFGLGWGIRKGRQAGKTPRGSVGI